MNLLNAEQLHKHLLEDLENCESYSFAIAWVTNNDYYQSIYGNIEKVETGVIGLNLYNTAPQVLEECCGICQHSCHPYLNQATKTSVALTRLDGRTGLRAVG